jgi:hypothetical protein
MRRRDFITLLGGAAAAGWPLASRVPLVGAKRTSVGECERSRFMSSALEPCH